MTNKSFTEADFEAMSQEDFETVLENIEHLDELSKTTLGSYIKKASSSRVSIERKKNDLEKKIDGIAGAEHHTDGDTRDHLRKARNDLSKQKSKLDDKDFNRGFGIRKAVSRLTKESFTEADFEAMSQEDFDIVLENIEHLDELSKETLKSYIKKNDERADSRSNEIAHLQLNRPKGKKDRAEHKAKLEKLHDKNSEQMHHAFRASNKLWAKERANESTNPFNWKEFVAAKKKDSGEDSKMVAKKTSTGTSYTKRNTDEPEKSEGEQIKRGRGRPRKSVSEMVKDALENGVEINELSKKTLTSYVKKSEKDAKKHEKEEGKHMRAMDKMDRTIESPWSDEDHEKYVGHEHGMGKAGDMHGKRITGIHNAKKRLAKEGVDALSMEELDSLFESFDQLDELSKETLTRYSNTALSQAKNDYAKVQGATSKEELDASSKRLEKRLKGRSKAVLKLAKEDFDGITEGELMLLVLESDELNELSKATLGSYIKKATKSATGLATTAMHHKNASDDWAKVGGREGSKGSKRFGKYSFDATQKQIKREKGVSKAADRLTKEETDLEEGTYRGNRPKHIKSVGSTGKPGELHITTYDGTGYKVHARDIGSKAPKLGEHISKYVKESVVDWSRFERSQSLSEDLKGQWMFSKHSSGYRYGHEEGTDFIKIKGTLDEALVKVDEWTTETGYTKVYALESFVPEKKSVATTFTSIVSSALDTNK